MTSLFFYKNEEYNEIAIGKPIAACKVVRGGDSRELLIRALPQRYGKCTGIFHLQMAGR